MYIDYICLEQKDKFFILETALKCTGDETEYIKSQLEILSNKLTKPSDFIFKNKDGLALVAAMNSIEKGNKYEAAEEELISNIMSKSLKDVVQYNILTLFNKVDDSYIYCEAITNNSITKALIESLKKYKDKKLNEVEEQEVFKIIKCLDIYWD